METAKLMMPQLLTLGVVTFVAALLALIIWTGWSRAKRGRERAEAVKTGGHAVAARIVDFRDATGRRSIDFRIVKILFEITLDDVQKPTYSAICVWEVEASAFGAIKSGSTIPVRVDPDDLRRVVPDFQGVRWSETYQHALLGIENDFRPEALIDAGHAAPLAPRANYVYRKTSKARIFGLPLWEVAFNLIAKNGPVRYAKNARARAIIAIGDSASGVIAIGAFARGIVAIGQFSVGFVALGTGGIGVVSASIMPIGVIAVGAIAAGGFALGGIALGFAAAGFLPIARYVITSKFQSVEIQPLYNAVTSLFGGDELLRSVAEYGVTLIAAASFIYFIGWFFVHAFLVAKLRPNTNRL